MSGERSIIQNKQRLCTASIQNILVACALCLSPASYAQNNDLDIIFLKSGTELKGTVIDTSSSSGIAILLQDSASRWVSNNLIDSIALNYPATLGGYDPDTVNDNTHYQGILEIGLNAVTSSPENSEENYPNQFAVNFVNGLAFRNQISAGIGVGLRIIGNRYRELLPVFLDLRYGLLNKPVSPCINAGVGPAFELNGNRKTVGTMFFINGGLRIRLNQNSALMLTVGYEQSPLTRIEDTRASKRVNEGQVTKAVNIKVGVAF